MRTLDIYKWLEKHNASITPGRDMITFLDELVIPAEVWQILIDNRDQIIDTLPVYNKELAQTKIPITSLQSWHWYKAIGANWISSSELISRINSLSKLGAVIVKIENFVEIGYIAPNLEIAELIDCKALYPSSLLQCGETISKIFKMLDIESNTCKDCGGLLHLYFQGRNRGYDCYYCNK